MHKSNPRKLNMSLISFPVGEAFVIPLSNLTRILCHSAKNVYIMTGNGGIIKADPIHIKTQIHLTFHKKSNNIFNRIIRHLLLQIRISFYLIKLSREIDLCFFFMEEGAVLPMVISKVFRKKILWVLPSNISGQSTNVNRILQKIGAVSTSICRTVSDRIVLYSINLVEDWQLGKYKNKISLAHEQFIDIDNFKAAAPKKNGTVISFIGRFSEEKGIMNFVKAIPLLLQVRSDISFLICGDGPQKIVVEKYLTENNLHEKVEFFGWIKHEALPDYFRKIRLLVVPSITEGLPNIMLEAMACSTPVLATRVGAIPNAIRDNYTGLLMDNNSPECISENVLRALNCSDLEKIAQNALTLIHKEFTFIKAAETYHDVLNTLIDLEPFSAH